MDNPPEIAAFLAYLPAAAPCGIYVRSLVDGVTEYVNPAYTAITGRGLADVPTTAAGLLELVHPDDREAVRGHLERICRGPVGQVDAITYRFRHQQGQWIWCSARDLLVERTPAGMPLRMLGTFIDISGQKTLELELSESQERLSLAAEAGKIGIWDWNLLDGTSTNDRRVHQQFDVEWGAPNEAALWFARIHADDVGMVQAAVEAAVAGRADYNVRYRVRWRDGSIHHLMAKGMVIRDSTGVAQRLLGMNLDMTEQVELQQRMEHHQKMEAIGQLAGGIAHDFNNQLTAVLGNAEMLRRHLDDPKLLRFVEPIIVAANRSADLTRQLLNYARQGVVKHTRFDIQDVISEVVEILQHSIDKRIVIRRSSPETPVVLEGDESNLQSALLNLALNARDAMPDGGTLTFTTEAVTVGDGIRSGALADLAPGRYVRVSIIDTGIGIPAALLPRVREPFFTTKEVGAGTGLGLSAADGIAQRHGGVLTIDSAVGRGTTMAMYLPYPPLDPGTPVMATPEPWAHDRLSVLLIDDESTVVELLASALNGEGHQVHCESDPLAGIAYFADHWRGVDLIILDMTMPRLNGAAAFERLRAINHQVPLLIISGHSFEGAVDQLIAKGGVAFLQKPFSLAQLRAALGDRRIADFQHRPV